MSKLIRGCLAFLLAGTMVFSLMGTALAETKPTGPASAPFFDTYGTKYQAAVDALYALGVVTGASQYTFQPEDQVTRAQMAIMVARALGQNPTAPSSAPFADVPADFWAAGAIAFAAQAGIVVGDGGYFRPNDPVTYSQAVTMLIRTAGLESQIVGGYPTGYVLKARDLGLLDSVDWGLDKPAKRGDIALMLYRLIFHVQRGGSGATISQTVFSRAGSITIEPADGALVAGVTQLKAHVLDWVGKDLAGLVTWSVVSGNAMVTPSGILTVSGTGDVTVMARMGDISTTKTYAVLQSLSVTADKATVQPGETVQLQANGKTATGEAIPVSATWSVVSGSGTVSQDGKLMASGTGAVKVRARVGLMTADTTITVVGSLVISPVDATLAAGQSVTFSAYAMDAAGQKVTVPVTWSATGSGTIDANGKFVAGSDAATVTAKSGSLIATASVKVASRLSLTPSAATLKKGDSQAFTATVYTSANQIAPATVAWSVDPPALGFLSADGKFFASGSGTGYVVAKAAGLTSRVPVSIAGTATGISVTATPSPVPANGTTTVTITARLTDANGATAIGADSIFFSVSSSRVGTLDASNVPIVDGQAITTLTVGTTPGSYTVYAAAPGTTLPSGSAAIVSSVPSISYIQLEAYPNPFAADNVSQTTVTAKLIDITGAQTVNNTNNMITVYLSPNNTNAGHLNNSTIQIPVGAQSGVTYFTAGGMPGSTVISGTSSYQVHATTVTSQVVGGAYQLKLRPAAATSAKADGSQEVVLYAEVEDANGNAVTGNSSALVSLNATSGTNVISIPSQQASWGVATFRLKTTYAGTYDVKVWSANQGLQQDSTQVTFTAGPPYKLALSVDEGTSLAADGITRATLRAKIQDVNGNTVTSASNQVSFVREENSQLVTDFPSVSSVNPINGEATLALTTTTAVGVDYFHAQSSGLLPSTAVAVSTRITGVPVKLTVLALGQPTVAAGANTAIKVAVMDQLNQIVTSDNGRMITLNVTNGAVTDGPNPTVNGIASFTVSNTKAGGVGVTASGVGVSADLTGRLLNVSPGAPDHVVLTATPDAISADTGSHSTIRASVVDQFGNVTGSATNMTLSVSTNEYLTMSSTWLNSGGNVLVTSKGIPGTTVISASSSSYVVTPLTLTTYRSGAPAKVVLDPLPTSLQAGTSLGNQAVIKARILDADGNPVTSLNTGSTLTAMALQVSGSTGNSSTTITTQSSTGLYQYGVAPNGVTVGSANVTAGAAQFTLTNTKAETITLTPVVYYQGTRLLGESSTLTTLPGAASKLTISASTTTVLASTATPVTLTASVTDAYGNQASTADDTVSFAVSGSAFGTPAPSSVPAPNGLATTQVVSNVSTYGGTATITAKSSKFGFTGTLVLVVDRVPDAPTVIAYDSSGNDSIVTSNDRGARITVTASARNSAQQVIVYVNGVNVTLYTDTSFSSTVDSIAAGTNSLTGYVKYSDLGGTGTKDVQAVVQTGLGISPLSNTASLTVR